MKKILYSLFVIVTIGLTSGCKRVFDTPNESALDPSVVFSTPSLAESAVVGILQSFGETNSYRGRYLVNHAVNTDVEVNNSLKSSTGEQQRLANYNTNVDNGQMNTDNNAWAKFYEAIERANLAISGIKRYGNPDTRPEMAQILGEVLTLRAVLYNDLIKGWGNVPARFEPVTTETQYVPRSDKDVIYKQLLKDLDEAAALLPWPNKSSVTSTVERVNKAFAKGLRARLALAAGGFSKHLDGATRLSNDPDLAKDKMYAIAKKECLDIINSGELRLLGFEEIFRKFHDETHTAGLESMWEIPFSENRGRVIFDLGVNHAKTDRFTGQNRGGTDGPNPIMLYEYDRDDVRRDVSVVAYGWDRANSDGIDKGGFQVPSTLSKLYFGKFRYEWLKRRVTNANDDGLNWMYMRYADVILMAAESINELDGAAAAAPYLRMILTRAFPNNAVKVNTYMAAATVNSTTFFNAIVDQRALEFCGEMLRKADLIRWNLLTAKLAEARTKLQQLDAREGKYAALPARIYYRTSANGETVEIYGLNFGDTDAIGAAGGYTANKAWTLSSSGELITYWNALYVKDPNSQPVWPIWQIFLDSSNGILNNNNF